MINADLSLPFSDEYLLTHPAFRPLKRTEPMLHGCDVYALQTALQMFKTIDSDGWFGDETHDVVKRYQEDNGLKVDAIAGTVTQRHVAARIANSEGATHGLPPGVPYGTVEYECSWILGNYTRKYDNGSRDEGPVECNTKEFEPSLAFDTPMAIIACCRRIHDYHEKYKSWGVADPRAWRLACGSWNAPSWCDTLAKGGTLSDSSYKSIKTYIDAVTAYAALN